MLVDIVRRFLESGVKHQSNNQFAGNKQMSTVTLDLNAQCVNIVVKTGVFLFSHIFIFKTCFSCCFPNTALLERYKRNTQQCHLSVRSTDEDCDYRERCANNFLCFKLKKNVFFLQKIYSFDGNFISISHLVLYDVIFTTFSYFYRRKCSKFMSRSRINFDLMFRNISANTLCMHIIFSYIK